MCVVSYNAVAEEYLSGTEDLVFVLLKHYYDALDANFGSPHLSINVAKISAFVESANAKDMFDEFGEVYNDYVRDLDENIRHTERGDADAASKRFWLEKYTRQREALVCFATHSLGFPMTPAGYIALRQ